MTDNNLIRGDSSTAFGQNLLRITLSDPDGLLVNHSISKCEIRFNGCVTKVIENPEFPLVINLTSEESDKLSVGKNTAVMAVWDENGEKLTTKGGQIILIGAKKV